MSWTRATHPIMCRSSSSRA